MTPEQIEQIMVRACQVDRKLPNTARPSQLKAVNIGIVHSFADMAHWHAEELHQANWAWLDPDKLKLTTKDMAFWDLAMELVKLVPSEKNRRALWGWARCEASGKSFEKWCKTSEGISRQLGEYRRTKAIEHICRALSRKPLQHNEKDELRYLRNTPEIDDKRSSIRVDRPDSSKPICGFDEDLRDFSWAEAQNARRRQREERRRQAA